MKTICILFVFSLLLLTGCATTTPTPTKPSTASAPPRPKDTAETVMVTYHVKPGMENIFEDLLSKAWDAYRKNHLVLSEPHVIVREAEGGNKTGYTEIFTWVNHAAPDHAPDSVKQLWAQEVSLCEPRNGKPGLGGGEVEPIVPPRK